MDTKTIIENRVIDEDYINFIKSKEILFKPIGFPVELNDLNDYHKPFQAMQVKQALSKGRCAVLNDTGLGKTCLAISIAYECLKYTGKPSIIIAPAVVISQFIEEGLKMGIDVTHSDDGEIYPITITSYGMVYKFDTNIFGSVGVDESSIMKSDGGKWKKQLIEKFKNTQYRFCFTATPSPNDVVELGGHSEFLGIMTEMQMRAAFFVNRGNKEQAGKPSGWDLKRPSIERFYKWFSSWALCVTKPSDIGDYDDTQYILPKLTIKKTFVESDYKRSNELVYTGPKGIADKSKLRNHTVDIRAGKVAEIANSSDEQFLIFCAYNNESEKCTHLINGAVEVSGKDSRKEKDDIFSKFKSGEIRVIVTKVKIAGLGMNFQNCRRMIFMGLDDSFEKYYQGIRRIYRFGQLRDVFIDIVLSTLDDAVARNISRKEKQFMIMRENLIKYSSKYTMANIQGMDINLDNYSEVSVTGKNYRLYQGDNVMVMPSLGDESVDFSIYSPPFEKLFAYTQSPFDMSNSRDVEEFLEHYAFLLKQLYRVLKAGRVMAVHAMDIPAMKNRDGYIGLKPFSNKVVDLIIESGFIYTGRIPIDKNQQAKSILTNAKQLNKRSFNKDRSWLAPALPDYLLIFRKPGENKVHVNGGMEFDEWIEFANPIWPMPNSESFTIDMFDEHDRCGNNGLTANWYGIKETDVIQKYRKARDNNAEIHLCPLQLKVIWRAIRLWSNPGEVVLDPFNGVGSSGKVALELLRKYIGIELNRTYFGASMNNLENIAGAQEVGDLFSYAGIEV